MIMIKCTAYKAIQNLMLYIMLCHIEIGESGDVLLEGDVDDPG